MKTIFTQIINREVPARILWENDDFICFLPNSHFVNKGHILLVPKQEVDYIFDLHVDLYKQIWEHAKVLSEVLNQVIKAPRIGLAVEGFSVPHVHIHLCPIYEVGQLSPERSVEWTEQDRDDFVVSFQKALNE